MYSNLFHRLLAVVLLVTCLLLHTAEAQSDDGRTYGFISFAVTELVADEDSNSAYTTISIPFVREIGSQGSVVVTYRVTNSSASGQFLSVSNSANFQDSQTESNGFLILVNDAAPEVNQTYVVDIIDARFGAEVGPVDRLYLTIRDSDDPFGRIQFATSSLVESGVEPLTGVNSSVSYEVTRGPGLHGEVTVDYEVTGGPNSASLDVSPSQGQLMFAEGQNTTTFAISILPDSLPENNETFTVRLRNPRGGAVIVESNKEAQLIIISNDTPLRFASSMVEVSESIGAVKLVVYRGDIGGVAYGPLDQVTTVQYATSSTGTAIAGLDYSFTSGTLSFPSGSSNATISIPIINDTLPEGDETFVVTLSNPSSDAVLHSPTNVTVIIDINDNAGGIVRFQSTATQVISEDNQTNATFIIQRDISSLGALTVSYSIRDSSNQLASSDFDPSSGTVSIANGVNMTALVIRAIDDTLPEEAESFTVSIDGVQSGAGQLSNETLRVALLYVSDSDDVYGIIGTSGSGKITVNSDGIRIMSFTLSRSQGTAGQVEVLYRVLYLSPGVTDPSNGESGVASSPTNTATFPAGTSSLDVSLSLLSSAFLEENALIYIELVLAELTDSGSLLVTPSSSPHVSTTSFTVNASIPLAAANGFISFARSSLTATVSEPDNGFNTVTLTIQRYGQYGDALVTWTTSGSSGSTFSSDDIGINAAQVLISNGDSSASFSIGVVADDIPELNESFNVQLLSVAQAGQDIAPNNIISVVTILENDNPGGTFSIASSSEGPFYIEESPLSSVAIQIQRGGGDLTTEQILYRIIPSGSDDFIGASSLVTFAPTNRTMSVDVAAALDDIPEINETFTFEIYSTKDNIVSPSNVSITILANDDWNGVFSFNSSSVSQTIDEPPNPGTTDPTLVSTATLFILRSIASFGEAVVYWEASDLNTNDITPTSGSVLFNDGETQASFQVSAQPDNITELDISHMFRLVSVLGGGRVNSSGDLATVTVRQSDDPVSIMTEGLFVRGEEGETLIINVTRGGRANGIAVVSYSLIYSTATGSDVTITPYNNVTLSDGDRSGTISITILDDTMPELMEEFQIMLTSVTGDAVIASSNTISTITISESDDPYGLFQFTTGSLTSTANEGDNVKLTIERLKGSIGNVTLFWRAVYDDDGVSTPVPPLTDIGIVSDSVFFEEGQTIANVTVTILNDEEPELTEYFMIELTNTTLPELLIAANGTANITVLENDSPYGIFQFASSDDVLWLAEDVPEADTTNGTGIYNVTRTAGNFNDIKVVWEIRSVSAPSLPTSFTDLLLVGSPGSGVVMETPRPSTNTTALAFPGGSASLVTIPSSLNPPITNDISISLWFKFNTPVNGVLLASSQGSTVYYGVALVSDNNQYIIRFLYLPSTLNSGFQTVEVSVSNSMLPINQWHHLVLTVSGTSAKFYIDGSIVNTRTLTSSLSTGSGTLTVGGLVNSQYFVGSLQDVRIYRNSLTQQQVSELYSNTAADHFQYVTGVITVPQGHSDGSFTVQTKDDTLPQPTTNYTLSLVAVSGEAMLSTNTNITRTILTVLKSDYSNGLFGLSSLMPFDTVEGSTADIPVIRSRSSIGVVTVTWEIRDATDGSLAVDDFEESSGTLVFNDGVTESYFTIQSTNETVPELDESFTVSLTALSIDDVYPSTTPTSGASLHPPNTTLNVTIPSNDYPYGILQFESGPPPLIGIIPPGTAVASLIISEEDGSITVYVARAQGTVGTASVDYTTSDGTALSGGVSPDYVPTGGSLAFADGERVRNFSITIRNDETPELAKYFYVNLSNPIGNDDGAPILGIASDIVITISPSDDAYGVFSFSDDSLSQVVSEDQSGSRLVSYVVERGNKGRLGTVTVYWEVVNGGNDVSQSSGSIVFGPGVPTSVFFFTINNDINPELHENFTVRLVNVSNGRISSDGDDVAILTIRASDRPYGFFTFSPSFSPLSITEDSGSINVIIVREFGMEGTVEVYYTSLNDSIGEDYATAGEDYNPVSGSVVFAPNQTMATFTVTIIDDTVPEIPEIFYIILLNATLLSGDSNHLGSDALPIVSTANASISVDENDNARGIFSFTSSSFTAEEGSTDSITVTRTGGTYGEVTLSWFITFTNASASDVNKIQGTDTVPDGVSLAPLGITVIDDSIPEFSESFIVALTSISGGADFGSPLLATVTIPTSDDPYGSFVFSESSRYVSVSEPLSGMTTVTLNVTREGGALGLAFVDYNVTSASGEPVSSDLSYDSISNLYFANGVRERSLTIRILPDDIPEVTEIFYVNLYGVTGGGSVGDYGVAQISILANDKPYGNEVFLRDSEILVMEDDDDNITTFTIPLYRTGGLFGDVSVVYSIRSAIPSSLDRYSSPTTGVSPPNSVKISESSDYVTNDQLNECGVKCVEDYTICQSFAYDSSSSLCQLYRSTTGVSGSVTRASTVQYYEAIPGQLELLFRHIATAGQDFEYILNDNVTIRAGRNSTSSASIIEVSVNPDTIPELRENFTVSLMSISVSGVTDQSLLPVFGNYSSTVISIGENDDPYGIFSISVSQLNMIQVQEPSGSGVLPVTITITRSAGTNGVASVSVNVTEMTATMNNDFTINETMIEFADGESSRTVTVYILGDTEPERDESFNIHLTNPTGGTSIEGGGVTVAILTNDNAAGTVGLASDSRAATINEGGTIRLTVERTVSQLGRLMVNWTITGSVNSTNNNNNQFPGAANFTGNETFINNFTDTGGTGPESQFQTAAGFIVFEEGVTSVVITTVVIDDAIPEVQEPYYLTLVAVETLTSGVGVASLDPSSSVAVITIRASDDPHGIVEIPPILRFFTTEESSPVIISVVRNFGSIGSIVVTYEAIASSISLSAGDTLATPGLDFDNTSMTIIIGDGEASGVIQAPIINDNVPELSEVFVVQLVSAHLESDTTISVPLDPNNTLAQITITANDNPAGTFQFTIDQLVVSEDIGTVNVSVVRTGGRFGEVTVLFQAIGDNQDFTLVTPRLVFADQESNKTLVLNIINDMMPELDQEFTIQIFSAGNGEIGTLSSLVVNITANDDYNGRFMFSMSSLSVVVEEAGDVVMNENVAELTVIRDGGNFGTVTVPYMIESSAVDDLSPSNGLLIFDEGVTQMSIMLTAVADSDPELNETYSVYLQSPIGGASRLSDEDTVAMVTILANQNPYGTFELFAPSSLSSVSVEENVGTVMLELRRSTPSFDDITVTIATYSDSSMSNDSNVTIDYIPVSSPLLYEANVSMVQLSLGIIDDDEPELDETLTVELVNVSGGAMLGNNTVVTVIVLTNDDAYGAIGFAQGSLSTVLNEPDFFETALTLTVERTGGLLGNISAQWSISGDHSVGEITPANGTVTFDEGQNSDTIILTITSDQTPEIGEVTRITLTSIIDNGVPEGGDQSKGASITSSRAVAVVTINANDDPFGSVAWSDFGGIVTGMERDSDSTVSLSVVRTLGTHGDIEITYRTQPDPAALPGEDATGGSDYVNVTSGTVTIRDGQTSATVDIIILPDDIPETGEFFVVELVEVRLINESLAVGAPANSPSLGFPIEIRVSIAENDFPQGLMNIDPGPFTVSEDVGSTCIPVYRSGGMFSFVGATFTFQDGSATGGSDFGDTAGVISVGPQVAEQCITVNITNDNTPETDESFTITLSNPTGGVTLGNNVTATIIILENDDINGVFSFASSSLVMLIPEGNSGTFTIERSAGSSGECTVYWSLSDDGTDDMNQTNGTVVFANGETSNTFELGALQDGVPELYETHTVTLTSVTGGGRLSHPLTSSIAIPANDNPAGIIAFAEYTYDTILIQEGGSGVVTVYRTAGLFGTVTVQWQITPTDTSAFTLTTGTALFNNGDSAVNITITTIQDTNPEVAKRYTLSLVAAGDANINSSSSDLIIIIPASDNVHGSVGFSPTSSSSNEDVDSIDITILRSGGLEGDLLINFTVSDGGAASPSDYQINSSYIMISDGSNTGIITAAIIDDTVPEIDESFSLTLTSVTLLNYENGGRDFTYLGDDSLIDSLPTLSDSADTFEATISSNDDAFGVINLSTNSYQVSEGTTLTVNVIRSGGTFGTLSLYFTVQSGTALGNGIDYSSPTSPINISPGQSSLQLTIPIIDDITPELQESFTVTINRVEGGASLGTIRSATVIILPSDNPNGRVRFTGSDVSGRVVSNPVDGPADVMLEVLRLDGSIGSIDVTWEVTGPDPGFEREDILQSTLQGVLTFDDQQTNNFITVTVLTIEGPEPEENFTITLTAATKGVAIDEDGQTALLTVSQKGIPFGVIGFYGTSLSTSNTAEGVNLTLPLVREQGTFGVSEVFFVVSGPSPLLDLSPVTGSVLFEEGAVYVPIELYIIPDNVPELLETYTVTLTGINGKATLNSDTTTSTFNIIANDSPYGTFGIADLSLQLVYAGEDIIRRLGFTITRQFGLQGSVDVTISIIYTDEPDAGYFPSTISRSFINGQNSVSVTVDSTATAYLAAGSILNVSVVMVTLTSQAGDSDVLPEISPLTGIVLYNISENVSNPSVGFALDDINATVIDGLVSNNVPITIQRHGLVGNVQVTWSTGLLIDGVANGSLTPSTGSYFMAAETPQLTINFTATPADPPTQPEVFAIHLAVESRSPLVSRLRTGAGLSVIEPWGVVKLTYETYSALEGQTVNVSVSRLYGSSGAIQVSGVAKSPSVVPDNVLVADPVIDYPLATLSTILNDKQTTGDIHIILPFNNLVNPLKVFDFSLTGLRRVNHDGSFATPRLELPIQNASVTIIDAQGGAGVFQFVSSSTIIHEDGSPLVQALINRTSGTAGTVTVQLSIVEARADGTTPPNQIASASEGDYDPSSLVTMVTFGNGEMLKSVTVQVLNDNVPELEEYFTVHLQNPQGGKAIIDPNKSTFEIGIYANDNQGGIFSLLTTSLDLDEDTQPEGTITVSRTGGLFERITIDWQTYYSDGGFHPVALGQLLVRDSGNVTFSSGQSLANITLALSPNEVPASGESFSLRIYSSNVGITFAVTVASITAAPSRFSVYQFPVNSRSVVATGLVQSLTIQRVQGLKLSSQVSYSTVASTDPITVGEVTFSPAMASVHFTSVSEANVPFPIDVGNVTINLNIISTDTVPRAFYVTLSVLPDSSSIVQNERAVIVINPAGTESDLYHDYLTAYQATQPSQLNSVATDIMNKLADGTLSGRNVSLSNTMKLTIEEIISTVTDSGISYPASLQSTMADIFDLIIRSGTYDGQFRYALALKGFARSLTTGKPCDGKNIVITKVSYKIKSGRYIPSSLSGTTFSFGVNDYIRLSNSPLQVDSTCINAHFIQYTDPSLYELPLLGTKVMVLSLDDPSVPTLSDPVMYRIRSPSGAIYPSDDDCLVWSYPTDDSGSGSWDQTTCTLAESSIVERDYVECQCLLVGDYAIAIPPSYGWTLPGPISCGFVVLVMILVIALHTIYFRRIQLGTRILIFLCVSVALFQVILLIDMVLAPTVSTSGCVALGLLLQLAVLAQFVWMFVLVMALWMNLMGLTDGNEPLIVYILVSWGLALAIVVATILVSMFGAAQSWSEIYGRVGELCFMPSPAIAGISSALPIVLFLLIGVGILSHSCFYWSRWEDIKSLYKDTYNKREIPLLLTFMTIIVINAIFGALHLYLQQIYLFFLFFAFNIIEGIYALIVYVFVSWHTLTWKHKHYPIKEDVEPLTIPEEPEFIAGDHYASMYGSQLSLLPRTSTVNKLSSHGRVGSQEQLMMTRLSPQPTTGTPSIHSTVKPASTAPEKSKKKKKKQQKPQKAESSLPPSLPPSPPPPPEGQKEKEGDSDSGDSGSYNVARPDSDGGESGSHMDNLMFALKTGISYSQDEDSQPPMHEMEGFAGRGRQPAAASEQYRLRRISIADTHL